MPQAFFNPSQPIGQYQHSAAGGQMGQTGRFLPWRLAKSYEQFGRLESGIFADILKALQGQGNAAMADVRQSGQAERGEILNNLVSSGLANTSVYSSLKGHQRERENREISRIREDIGRLFAGAHQQRMGNYMSAMSPMWSWILDNEKYKQGSQQAKREGISKIVGAGIGAFAGAV